MKKRLPVLTVGVGRGRDTATRKSIRKRRSSSFARAQVFAAGRSALNLQCSHGPPPMPFLFKSSPEPSRTAASERRWSWIHFKALERQTRSEPASSRDAGRYMRTYLNRNRTATP